MFKGLEKNIIVIIVVISTLSMVEIRSTQNCDYNQQLSLAEKLIKPHVGVFDLHNSADLKAMTINLIKAAKNPNIHGILLWIDSNGGNSALFSSVHDTLLRIRTLKPVVVLIRGNAFSGAYHIASAADYIFAHSESMVGSIGTVCTISRYKNPKIKEDGVEADLETILIKHGKYKTTHHVYNENELTDEEKSEIQKGVTALAERFIANVANNRILDIARADQWADARKFIAHEAAEIRLIDEVGTLFEAEAKIVELIRVKNPGLLVSATVEYSFF